MTLTKQTRNILKAGAAGMARSVQGKGGAHVTRRPVDARAAALADEAAEGYAEYLERKVKV